MDADLFDDVSRDITRRIRDRDLLPYDLARAVAEDAARTVFDDVQRWRSDAVRTSPISSTEEASDEQ